MSRDKLQLLGKSQTEAETEMNQKHKEGERVKKEYNNNSGTIDSVGLNKKG